MELCHNNLQVRQIQIQDFLSRVLNVVSNFVGLGLPGQQRASPVWDTCGHFRERGGAAHPDVFQGKLKFGSFKTTCGGTNTYRNHLDFSSTAKTSLLCLIFSLWWSWCTTEAITSTPTPGTKCAPSSCCYLHYTDDRFFPSANHQIVSNKVMSQGPQSNINDAALLLLLHHLFTFLSNSDDHLLKNIELFDRLSLSFNSRVLFIKDVIGDEICCWSFYGQGRKLAEVCCTSIVYATEKKQTKVRGRWPFYMVCPETQTEVL